MAKPTFTGTDTIVFDIVNERTVERLRREGKVVLPRKKVDIPKDRRWNEKTLATALLRGIENGDSVQKVAQSIFPEIMSKTDFTGKTQKQIYGKGGIIAKNRQSAIRNARTMMTSAENNGRLDSMKDLESQGVIMKKVWESTPDDRTRPTHIDIDGEEQDLETVFSNGCQFPGDGRGPAEEVWMCRCSMKSRIIGFKRSDGSISKVEYQRDRTLHDEQMEEERARREAGKTPKAPVVTVGKTGKGFFDDEVERILNLLEQESLSRDVFLKFVGQLDSTELPTEKGHEAYFSPTNEKVHLYPDKVALGNTYENPFTVFFHEYGHNIDYLAGGKDKLNYYSSVWRNAKGKSFEEIITAEWEKKFTFSGEGAMWKSFEGNLDIANGGTGAFNWTRSTLNDWRKANGISPSDPRFQKLNDQLWELKSDNDFRNFIKNNIDIFNTGVYNESETGMRLAIGDFCREMKDKYTLKERSLISDMFERFSVQHGGEDYPLGFGHGTAYAKREGSLAKEAFAEMLSAEIAQPESLKVIKEVLPESYEAFKEMLGGLL